MKYEKKTRKKRPESNQKHAMMVVKQSQVYTQFQNHDIKSKKPSSSSKQKKNRSPSQVAAQIRKNEGSRGTKKKEPDPTFSVFNVTNQQS